MTELDDIKEKIQKLGFKILDTNIDESFVKIRVKYVADEGPINAFYLFNPKKAEGLSNRYGGYLFHMLLNLQSKYAWKKYCYQGNIYKEQVADQSDEDRMLFFNDNCEFIALFVQNKHAK